jgi:hypothetical protein
MYMYVRGIDVAIVFFSHFLEGFETILTLRYFFHFLGGSMYKCVREINFTCFFDFLLEFGTILNYFFRFHDLLSEYIL